MEIKAIIFDMDGVIVDTEFLDFEIQRQFIAKENQEELDNDYEKFSGLVGRSYDALYRTIASFLKEEQSIETVKTNFERFNTEKYRNVDYTKLFRKEIIHILDYAKAHNIKLAVASSSEYRHIEEVLTACKIKDYFDVIYSGEFVQESKPHPEVYLNTLETLGVAAENTIAIEDSFYGITAAKRAGLTTIAYEEKRLPIDQTLADYSGGDMKEILEIIIEITNG